MIVIVVVAVTIAAILGFWAQRLVARRHVDQDLRATAEGLPTSELVIPVRTLAGLLLAFVLLSVYTSYQNAEAKAAAEAGSVLAMAREAELLSPSARDDVLGRLNCYARSVVGPDWSAQADNGRLSRVTDKTSDAITLAVQRASRNPNNRYAVSAILADDSQRIQARIQRADEGRPSVPTEVWLLLLITVLIMLGGQSALGHRDVRRTVHVAILAGTTVVFGLTLLAIYDLDHPYSGPVQIRPAAMLSVESRISALPGGYHIPCDANGTLK